MLIVTCMECYLLSPSPAVYYRCCACMMTPGDITDDNCCLCNTAAIRKTTGVHPDDVVYASFHNKVKANLGVLIVIFILSALMKKLSYSYSPGTFVSVILQYSFSIGLIFLFYLTCCNSV